MSEVLPVLHRDHPDNDHYTVSSQIPSRYRQYTMGRLFMSDLSFTSVFKNGNGETIPQTTYGPDAEENSVTPESWDITVKNLKLLPASFNIMTVEETIGGVL